MDTSAVPRTVLSAFLEAYPAYRDTRRLDALRRTEYSRLDRRGETYLDYTGGGLYAASQLRVHQRQLRSGVFANPHSEGRIARATAARIERARRSVLAFFGASPDDYLAVFTPNASGALKLVGESYPFGSGGRFLLPFDNHNSVNGIREFARAKGAGVTYVPLTRPDLRIDRRLLTEELGRTPRSAGRLFAFPAQSNFSGVQHPLELIEEAQGFGWDVMLDAAAFVPASRLDLARWKPDFVALSFYKMFGYPTGVGCLLARHDAIAKLRRPWFAGGAVRIASVQGDRFHRAEGAAGYEDGTLDYLSLPAVEIGLGHLTSVGMDRIHTRVRSLAGWLLDSLSALRHRNGRELVQIRGPASLESRGGSIAFNLFDPDGVGFDIRRVEEEAGQVRISLRTGCFCNPGAGESAYGLAPEQIRAYFQDPEGMTFEELRARVRTEHGIEVGAIRASLGIASNFADALRLVRFVRGYLDRGAREIGSFAAPGPVPAKAGRPSRAGRPRNRRR